MQNKNLLFCCNLVQTKLVPTFQSVTMLTDFRRQKYYHFFSNFWDFDKSGSINKDDVKALTDKTNKYKQWDKETIKEITEYWFKVFRSMLKELGKTEEELTLEEWYYLMQKYTEDPHETEWVELFIDFDFKYCCDKEKGGVTAESMVPLLVYFGIPEEDAKLGFALASQNKPVIDRAQYAILWKQFFTSDDRNAPGNFLSGKIKYV